MLSTLLYIYLSGFVVCEGINTYQVLTDPPSRVTTAKEQFIIGTALSVVWPVPVGFYLKNKIEGMK